MSSASRTLFHYPVLLDQPGSLRNSPTGAVLSAWSWTVPAPHEYRHSGSTVLDRNPGLVCAARRRTRGTKFKSRTRHLGRPLAFAVRFFLTRTIGYRV